MNSYLPCLLILALLFLSRTRCDRVADFEFLSRHVCSHEFLNVSRQFNQTHRMATNFQGK
jgi:hypothetical protein